MKSEFRFEVHDEEGPIRMFNRREEAKQYINGKCGLWLITRPRLKKAAETTTMNLVDAEPALY